MGIPNDFIYELARIEPDRFESFELLAGRLLSKRLLRELVWEIGLSCWLEAANTAKSRFPLGFPLDRNESNRRLARLGKAASEVSALVALLGLRDRFASGGSSVRGYRLFGIEEPVLEAIRVPYVRITEQLESLIGYVRAIRKHRSSDLAGFATRQEAYLVSLATKRSGRDPYPDLARLLSYAYEYVGASLRRAHRPVTRGASRRSFAPTALRRRVERSTSTPQRLEKGWRKWMESMLEGLTSKPAA